MARAARSLAPAGRRQGSFDHLEPVGTAEAPDLNDPVARLLFHIRELFIIDLGNDTATEEKRLHAHLYRQGSASLGRNFI
jgi:hypothetical protein